MGNGRTILLYLNDTLNYMLLSSQIGFQDAARIPILPFKIYEHQNSLFKTWNPLFARDLVSGRGGGFLHEEKVFLDSSP
jgi:hypothetical protein